VIATFASGWFKAGVAMMPNGEMRFVIDHTGDTIVLQTPMRGLVNGGPLTLFAGDDLTRATCKAKFDNYDRWMGWGWIPSKNPFTDNVFGTGYYPSSGKSKTDWRKAINPAGWNGSWGFF
jgi:hypothetical protein